MITGTVGKWNRSNSQTYALVTFSAQRKFTHKRTNYVVIKFWIIPFAICASRKTRVSIHVRPTVPHLVFRGVIGDSPWGEFRHETITLIVYNLMKTKARVHSYPLFFNFGIPWPFKTQDNFGHNAMLVADLSLREKEVILISLQIDATRHFNAGFPIFWKISFELSFKFHHLALEYHRRLSQIRSE